MSDERRVVLQSEGDEGGMRHLDATITANGDLVISGQDLRRGGTEYEWGWTVQAGDIVRLEKALRRDGPVLESLADRFGQSNAAGLKPFLDTHEIPYEFWSRVGD